LRLLQALADHCVGALERLRAETEIGRLNSELRGHLEELQTIFDVAPVGIAVAHDRECSQVSLNVACARLLGLESTGPLAKKGLTSPDLPFEVMRNGRKLSSEEEPMRRAARDGVVVPGQELDIATPQGLVLNCYVCASPLFDDEGQVRGSLGIFVDLTERKNAEQEVRRLNAELERRVRDRTMQLEAINKELEAFSYSVSHDLRAPLRSIRGFSEVLLERYHDTLDERGREFLTRACESCVQMDKLIEDLLKLSRVGRSELSWQDVNLSALAEPILAELRKSDPGRNVKTIVAPNLCARGDERLLRLALDNLLRNAWKFTSNQPAAVIEFGALNDGERAFFVRDNGAGFDMAYASKLFGVFQRLHTASEFPGTGIGLATVQRILSRHGGRAWAEGAVNRGATFYFALPNDAEA
jgi:PAS domain S-box-containing protein